MLVIPFKGKKGNAILIGFIVLLLLIYITSTQKVEINSNQISTATQQSCALIKKSYDPLNKICTNGNQTVQGQTSNI